MARRYESCHLAVLSHPPASRICTWATILVLNILSHIDLNVYMPFDFSIFKEICGKALSNRNRFNFQEVEMNLFFARDPSQWRPACEDHHDGRFILSESEDLVTVGTPNQIRYCPETACKDVEAPGMSCHRSGECSYAVMPTLVSHALGSENSVCFCE